MGAIRTRYVRPIVNGDEVAQVLDDVAAAIASALAGLDEWGLAGTRPGQYRSDLVADAAALAVLDEAGFGAFSEESGLHAVDREVVVVIDPKRERDDAPHTPDGPHEIEDADEAVL